MFPIVLGKPSVIVAWFAFRRFRMNGKLLPCLFEVAATGSLVMMELIPTVQLLKGSMFLAGTT